MKSSESNNNVEMLMVQFMQLSKEFEKPLAIDSIYLSYKMSDPATRKATEAVVGAKKAGILNHMFLITQAIAKTGDLEKFRICADTLLKYNPGSFLTLKYYEGIAIGESEKHVQHNENIDRSPASISINTNVISRSEGHFDIEPPFNPKEQQELDDLSTIRRKQWEKEESERIRKVVKEKLGGNQKNKQISRQTRPKTEKENVGLISKMIRKVYGHKR